MSQIVTAPSLELMLIAGRAIALIAGLLMFAWAFRHWRRAAMRDTQRVFEQLDLVRSELLIMKDAMHHAAHRADSVAHETRLAPATNAGAARGYEIAARMARNGSSKEELMRSCGLTSHEAELLIKLHSPRPAADSLGLQPRVAASESSRQATAVQNAVESPRALATPKQVTVQPKQAAARAPLQRSRLVAVG
ncbi:MAG TPA: DUF2802 domain-containing protein [Steroidobacteraceae bacterium]|nr:DUF2802 domain-containing protein [Steroidobacteraceae bacterium]